MNKVSMNDIARLSGVSSATVSRVINNSGRFSEETRKKVLKVIEETGYEINSVAKSLRMKQTYSIGLIVPDITNQFFAEIVQKIEEIFFQYSYSTIICNSGGNTEKEKLYLKMLESKMVDVLVFISGVQKFDVNKILSSNLPIIYIDRKPSILKGNVYISSDHYNGAREATNLLLESGAKHPAFLNYSRTSSSVNDRLLGFAEALKESNIIFDKEKNLIEVKSNKKINSNFRVTKALDKYYANNKNVDSIFAANDLLAINAVNYLLSIGKKIPEDIQVIGFDDNPVASQFRPKISTIRQDTDEIAELTSEYLLMLMKEKNKRIQKNIYIPTKIIERETTFNFK